MARLAQSTGSVSLPLPAIPVEAIGEEYFTTAKSNSTGTNYSELSIKTHNHTAWQARIPAKLSYRYFLDISEGLNAGFSANDYAIVTNYFPDARLASTKLKPWSGTIYYFEVIYDSTTKQIYPGGQGESKRESQVRVAAPEGAPWNSANDFSYTSITNTDIQSQNIAVYENNKLVYCKEPTSSSVPSFIIKATAGSNGTITPTGATTVTSGTDQTFTITPSAGYKIATLTVDGIAINANSSYTFSNVVANHTIAATFSVLPITNYIITASAGTNGTVTPTGNTSVTARSNKTYTITPNTGYKIATLLVDGTAVTNTNSYTFSNVTTNHTISTTFDAVSAATYTITATAAANGTISPSGVKTLNSGANQTYTMTANSGCQIYALKVNNVPISSSNTYTFTNVTSKQTIAITFRPVTNDGNCLLSIFNVLRNSALPSKNSTFKYVYVLVNSGPDLSTASMGTFNWDLQNNGLYDFSMNFNASPWYIGFAQTATHNLNKTSPSITINGSGISNFDNNKYYVNLINNDVVLIEISGSHAVYFSNSSTRPAGCSNTKIMAVNNEVSGPANTLYPVPAIDYINVNLIDNSGTNVIIVADINGNVVLSKTVNAAQEKVTTLDIKNLKEGVFIVTIKSNSGNQTKRFIKKN